MSVDTAFARLRDANPVPEPAKLRDPSQDLDALLATTRQRSREMHTELEPLETPKTPTPWWRSAMPALVAAAAVILVAAGFLLVTRNTEPDVADTPQGMAELFIEGDAETAVEMLATDAVVGHVIASSVEEYRAFRDWQVATGTFATVAGCSEIPIGSTVEVSCTYIHGNAWSEALGVGPFDGSQWVFVIADGQIQELRNTFDSGEYSRQSNGPFRSWLGVNHPDVVTMMIDGSGFTRLTSGFMRLTPESIALWEQYTNEFVASEPESGTP